MIQMTLPGVSDSSSEENFRRLNVAFSGFLGLFENFRSFGVSLAGATTQKRLYHRLGFIPEDVLVTKNSTGATVTLHTNLFTKDYFVLSTSAACDLNLLIGKFPNRTEL